VGILPPHFILPDRGMIWTPFGTGPAEERHENRGYAGAIGRLRPGVTIEQARADLGAVSSRLQKDFPTENFGWAAELVALRDDLVGDLRRPVLVFLGAV